MNIAEIAAEYIADKRRVRRESTVEGYESALRLHVLPRWGACGSTVARYETRNTNATHPTM